MPARDTLSALIIVFIVVLIIVLIVVFMRLCTNGRGPLEHFLAINNERQVSLHYTDWCPNCISMKPIWEQVKRDLYHRSGVPRVKFIEINEDIAKTPGVTGYPTIRMLLESGRQVEYHSAPTVESLKNWIISPTFLNS